MAVQESVGLGSPMKYFNEYMFYKTVESFNNSSAEPIKKRQALQMRDRLTEVLASKGKDIGNANKTLLLDSMDEIFRESVGIAAYPFDDARNEAYSTAMSEFSSVTGLKTSGGYQGRKGQFTGLPLSPYDP